MGLPPPRPTRPPLPLPPPVGGPPARRAVRRRARRRRAHDPAPQALRISSPERCAPSSPRRRVHEPLLSRRVRAALHRGCPRRPRARRVSGGVAAGAASGTSPLVGASVNLETSRPRDQSRDRARVGAASLLVGDELPGVPAAGRCSAGGGRGGLPRNFWEPSQGGEAGGSEGRGECRPASGAAPPPRSRCSTLPGVV